MEDQSAQDYLKGVVEALLFISDKPVEIAQIKEAVPTIETAEARRLISALQKDYDENDRGMMIREIAGGYQMLSNPQYAEYVRNFFKTRVKDKLSRPALEALAITAYRQPVSRADVELIRGVNSDGVATNLLEKGLIKIVGRKDVPGRPFLYGTTKLFLEYFGLKSLNDLPKLEDLTELMNAQEGGGGSGLFNSNVSADVEKSVADFGGENHLEQSFAREGSAEMFEELDDEIDDELPGEAQENEAADGMEEGAEKIEEPEDLKKVMEDLSRDGAPAEEPEQTVEANSASEDDR